MEIVIRQLGIKDYKATLDRMREFTEKRQDNTPDEIWLLEHPPVFTQGLTGKPEHLLMETDIPVIQTERGGQITYHGPGQLVCYLMINMRRLGLSIKPLVNIIEQTIIDLLKGYGLESQRKANAPGVYIGQAKIAALGLRVRRGNTFHGLAINVRMDLDPYEKINPCGFSGLTITQLSEHDINHSIKKVGNDLSKILCSHLNYLPQQRKLLDHF